jgi:hypothetical protein
VDLMLAREGENLEHALLLATIGEAVTSWN